MKKFAFRLQRVLDLREAQQQLKLAEFGHEQKRLGEEQQRLELFRQEEEQQLSEAEAGHRQPFAAWSHGQSCRYLQRIARVIDYQGERVRAQTQQVERARTRYLESRRDTQTLEKLREQHHDNWQADQLREEGKLLDEVGSRRIMS